VQHLGGDFRGDGFVVVDGGGGVADVGEEAGDDDPGGVGAVAEVASYGLRDAVEENSFGIQRGEGADQVDVDVQDVGGCCAGVEEAAGELRGEAVGEVGAG